MSDNYIPKIGQSGLDGQVGEFLEDLTSGAVIPPNLGFVQVDHIMDPAKISPLGMDSQVAEFLDDNISESVVSDGLV